MIKNQNIIFVDIDGVLTSMYETPGSYLNHTPQTYGLSPKCVERLYKLCQQTNSKIIISSNWRRFDDDGIWIHPRGRFQNKLPELRKILGDLYLGTLPKNRHISKSEALITWFNNHPEFNGKFVIFDDDKREQFQSTNDYNINKHFILTDYQFGLTDNDCQYAFEILKGTK